MVANVILSPTGLKLVPVPDTAALLVHAGVLTVTYLDVTALPRKHGCSGVGNGVRHGCSPRERTNACNTSQQRVGKLTDSPGFDPARSPWSE